MNKIISLNEEINAAETVIRKLEDDNDRLRATCAELAAALEECAAVAEFFWKDTNSLEKSHSAGKAARNARAAIAKATG